jgi:hypothetical protein
MITSKDLRKAPFKTRWIMNKENMKVTSYNGIPCVLWKKKYNIHLWSFNHRLFCIRERTIFDMDGNLCGWVEDTNVYGPAFGELPDLMISSPFCS